jgi:type IV secretory pathway VirB2 component (pilin)
MRTIALGCLLFACLAPEAAASTGGDSLPWETPLQTIADSISGPVAYAISLIGIVVAGAMLVWGGEINEFARRMIMLVLVISLIVFATQVLSTLFNVSGAVLP